MTKKLVCPGCHGVVTGTRHFTFETSVENHNKTCPARGVQWKEPEPKKKPKT